MLSTNNHNYCPRILGFAGRRSPRSEIVHIAPAGTHAGPYALSGRRNVLRLWTLGALGDVEIDLLVLF